MSIVTDQKVKELGIQLEELKKRVDALEALEKAIIEGDDDPVSDALLEELALRYKEKFGNLPHHRMKPETILRALSE
jgi:hypothetical protein